MNQPTVEWEGKGGGSNWSLAEAVAENQSNDSGMNEPQWPGRGPKRTMCRDTRWPHDQKESGENHREGGKITGTPKEGNRPATGGKPLS